MSKASRGADHPARERRLERLKSARREQSAGGGPWPPHARCGARHPRGNAPPRRFRQVWLDADASTERRLYLALVYARCFTGQGSVWDRRSGSTTGASISVSTSKPAPFPRPATSSFLLKVLGAERAAARPIPPALGDWLLTGLAGRHRRVAGSAASRGCRRHRSPGLIGALLDASPDAQAPVTSPWTPRPIPIRGSCSPTTALVVEAVSRPPP